MHLIGSVVFYVVVMILGSADMYSQVHIGLRQTSTVVLIVQFSFIKDTSFRK